MSHPVLNSLLRRSVYLVVVAAIIAVVREAMLRHHERDLRPSARHEP